MKKNDRPVVILFFLIASITITLLIVYLLGTSIDAINGDGIYTLSYSHYDPLQEVRIEWPNVKGVAFKLNKITHDNYLDIHLSTFDTYKIEFTLEDDVESIYVNTGVDVKQGDSYQKLLQMIPEYIVKRGFSKVTVLPVDGDGVYGIGHFSTVSILDNPDPSGFPDYQIIDFVIPKIEIELDEADYLNIEEQRKEALALGILFTEPTDFIPAKIKFDGHSYKTEIRLKGDWTDHLETDKWSFRINVKGGETILGMAEFAIQRQETRNGLYPYLINELYREAGGVTLRYYFIDVVVNGQYKGVYALEEGFSKLAVEHSLKREAPILKFNEEYLWERFAYYQEKKGIYYWSNIEPFSLKKTFVSPTLSGLANYGIYAIDRILYDDVDISTVIDLELFAKYAAIMDTFATSHGSVWHNYRLYINPITGRFEVIPFDDMAFSAGQEGYPKYLFQTTDIITSAVFSNREFLELYSRDLIDLSDTLPVFLKKQSKTIDDLEYTIRRDDPQFQFKTDELMTRQDEINDLFIDHGLRCYWKNNSIGQYSITITNYNDFITQINQIYSENHQLSFSSAFPFLLNYQDEIINKVVFQVLGDDTLDDDAIITINYSLFNQSQEYTAKCYKMGFSFFVAGHAYGTPGGHDGLHQPFLDYLDDLAKDESMAFGIFTGDFVENGADMASYQEFFEQMKGLNKPIFATAGNHDEVGSGENNFIKFMGAKFYSHVQDKSLFLFLDPDDQTWSISEKQIEFIKTELLLNSQVDNIFVLSHQLMWWEEGDPRFDKFIPNSLAGKNGTSNFWSEVYPLFEKSTKNVFFIAGDVGAFDNGSEIAIVKINGFPFIASGMGGGKRDNILSIYVDNYGVNIDVIALNCEDTQALGTLDELLDSGN